MFKKNQVNVIRKGLPENEVSNYNLAEFLETFEVNAKVLETIPGSRSGKDFIPFTEKQLKEADELSGIKTYPKIFIED